MPKVTDDYRAERRREIAAAAMRCFSRKGFEGTSMADIIAESGLSTGAIYLHFKSKHDLVRQVVLDVLRGRSDDLIGLVALDPMPEPTVVIRRFVNGMGHDLGGPSILVQVWSMAAREPELAGLISELIAELRRLFSAYFERWFAQHGLDGAAAAARADALVPMVVGICQGYVLQAAIVPDFDPELYLAAVALIDFAAVPAPAAAAAPTPPAPAAAP
ncbi:TetR/AcrR family transcriptional regulator [Herbiconiux daphne]|uniref:TetR/AcrR family transcriptional regulator n=1 Tax=Herbiconiux daphne TaxID=2970914 RepID=A0ABT2H7L3_9MICO|nr:TetR/AcrR family transcriptional regulator [Herbiconiux daphne]MCS5735945.1 TetR/AcrR family transcriptional regulator [Herbiconiux daphne]